MPAARLQLFTAVQRQQVFTAGLWLHMADAIHVHDRRTMDPDKTLRTEQRFQAVQRASREQSVAPQADVDVIPRCFHEVDLLLSYKVDLLIRFDQDSARHALFSCALGRRANAEVPR